jgi:hypothetical protein
MCDVRALYNVDRHSMTPPRCMVSGWRLCKFMDVSGEMAARGWDPSAFAAR